MHSGAMSLLGYPELCSPPSYRPHCYVPMIPSTALCSNAVNPNFGHPLPSSYQGNLWLLEHCRESYCDAPSCESPSSEAKTCTTSCDLPDSCVGCNTPSAGQVVSTCETTNVSPSPSCRPCTQTKGYVSNCCAPTQQAPKACQTIRSGSYCFGQLNYLPKSLQPLSYCRLHNLGYRRHPHLGFITSGFSPSCYIASSYQPQSYFVRNCQYMKYWPMSCRPLKYLSSNCRSLSCMPSNFPPLRYLCSGGRPLSCY